MIWAITIAAFLGKVVAVLLVFSALSWREQSREARREQRIERRTSAEFEVELYGLDEVDRFFAGKNVGARQQLHEVAVNESRPPPEHRFFQNGVTIRALEPAELTV
jgi:hypothetical protein